VPETAIGDTNDDNHDEYQGSRRLGGIPPTMLQNQGPNVPANDVGTAFQEIERCLCRKLNRRLITR
jgi:hypothetical protein